MTKHDESRRAFLVGAAVGAGAVGAGLVPDALAQTPPQHPASDATTAHAQGHSGGHGAFLNDDDAVTLDAFTERLMPGATKVKTSEFAGYIIENMVDRRKRTAV